MTVSQERYLYYHLLSQAHGTLAPKVKLTQISECACVYLIAKPTCGFKHSNTMSRRFLYSRPCKGCVEETQSRPSYHACILLPWSLSRVEFRTLLTKREQLTVFRLRTCRNRLNHHLYSKLRIGHKSSSLEVLAVRQRNICCSPAPSTSHPVTASNQNSLP